MVIYKCMLVQDLAKYQIGQIEHVTVPANVKKRERQKEELTITVMIVVMLKLLEIHQKLGHEKRLSKTSDCHWLIGL